MLVAPLHGFDPTMAPDFDRNLVTGRLSVSYSLFDGGGRKARIEGAEAGRALASEDAGATRMDLAVQTSSAYLEILSTRQLLEAARSRIQALEGERERVLQFLSVGKAAQVDLLRVEAALSQAQATEITLAARLDVARWQLSRMTGLPVQEIDARGVKPVQLRLGGDAREIQSMARATETSPEIALAIQRVQMAQAGVSEAQSHWQPSVHVMGAYLDYGTLEGGHTQEWQGALQLSYPLFTGGARAGALDQAQADEREASEALRRARLEVENAVHAAAAAVLEAGARRVALEGGVRQAEEVSRIEALALEVGSGVQTDFLRSQAELFDARAAWVRARHEEVLAAIRLARVKGDLTETWFEENLEVIS
jgi:outer membrane protein TolC